MSKATIISMNRLREDIRAAQDNGTLEIVRKLRIFSGIPFHSIDIDGEQVEWFETQEECEEFISNLLAV